MTPEAEAAIWGRYLLGGKQPDAASIALYSKALGLRNESNATTRDKKIVAFALRYPRTLGLLDSACALSHPGSLLRQKLLLMSAILETQPQYAHLFLPRERSFFYHFYIFFVGSRAVAKAVCGKILLAVI
ncbi:MAG: hypothetical protein IM638_16480 [Bacteroidetes bacterium]|nr:hypothetical protein [Bacteroidota bacterium]